MDARRVIDIAFGLASVAVGALVAAPVAIAIKYEDGGPLLYREERIGQGGKPFKVFKFRTLSQQRNEEERLLPRVTAVGSFLRHHSLDEIPQLINVVKGDMSLFGPRPLNRRDVTLLRDNGFGQAVDEREKVRPGLTGLSQITRRNYDPVKDRCPLNFRMESLAQDIEYLEKRHKNWLVDAYILSQTFNAVIHGHGLLNEPGKPLQYDLDIADAPKSFPAMDATPSG